MATPKNRDQEKRPGIRPKALGTVTVPAIPAPDLFAQTNEALGLDHVNEGFRDWNFFVDRNGRDLGYAGKTYEVVSWKKGRSGFMTGAELRSRFRELGYAGVVPAFLVWLSENRPLDTFCATLPEEDAKCCYSYQGRSYVASVYHYRDRTGSRLYAITPPHKCSPGELYLAFREVPRAE
jgi:hypothetical protein